eukprot:GCRY01002141.1.p1 GENE.GCRY01002141.1~~GCRY01002141.1.p1  ORF type:complete len:206 (-),score=10.08 GCRY01002141.1:352-969(-)
MSSDSEGENILIKQKERDKFVENEDMFYDAYLEDCKNEIQRLYHTHKKEESLKNLAHLAWMGGLSCQTYIGSNCLQYFGKLVTSSDAPEIIVADLEALSTVLRKHQINQDLFRSLGLIEILIDKILAQTSSLIRQWCTHVLFFALVSNLTNQKQALRHPHLMKALSIAAQENWYLWPANDGTELMKMMNLFPSQAPLTLGMELES